jgi:hypothetical protein
MTTENEATSEARSPRGRLAADLAERAAYKAKVKASTDRTAGVNEAYFKRKAEEAEQCRLQNERNAAAQKTQTQINEERIKNALVEAYPYRPWQKGDLDPLMQQEPEYVQRQNGYAPVAIKPSLVAETKPAESFVPPPQTFKPLTEAELQASRDRCEMAMVKKS